MGRGLSGWELMSGGGGGEGREMNLWRLDQSRTLERQAGNVSVQVCAFAKVSGGCVCRFRFTVQWVVGTAESGGARPSGGGRVDAWAEKSLICRLKKKKKSNYSHHL